MTPAIEGDPVRFAAARRVLTDTEYLTWAMAERGISHRAIAHFRRVSRGTVADTLARADRKVEEELHAQTAED